MIFSSPTFIFTFLPVALAVFVIARRIAGTWALGAIVLLSIFFYGAWDVRFLPLLIGSAVFNYGAAAVVQWVQRTGSRNAIYGLAVATNLAVLGYFKYANFFLDAISLGGAPGTVLVVLPLGISFFTFQNIVYLHGVWRRHHPAGNPLTYIACIFFFPHLIAGPIVLYGDLVSQFAALRDGKRPPSSYELGLFVFIVGLAKKLVLADSLAPIADAVFSADPSSLQPYEAWCGVLAYTFQIYFDFSGYSDMAIGLGLLFGIRLPLNFFSPYKSTSIIDFWRRWHMTLSRFLREYVYVPLGGNRRGAFRRYVNLLLTMLLGGLWHGAGWTFVAWGGLHGVLLCLNHAWRHLLSLLPWLAPARLLGWPVTFLSVVVTWVLFRATDFPSAAGILSSMSALRLPAALDLTNPFMGLRYEIGQAYQIIAGAAVIALCLPNTSQLVGYGQVMGTELADTRPWYRLRVGPTLGLLGGVMLVASVSVMTRVSPFIYFQF